MNVWSVFSFGYIIKWILLATFAYFIIPDKSTNANQGSLLLSSKPPFSSVQVFEYESPNRTFKDFWLGQNYYTEKFPISKYYIKNDDLVLVLFDNNQINNTIKLIPLNSLEYNDITNIEKKYIKKITFWLGTDKAGRDYLSRIILGGRVSLAIGFVAVFISLVIGIFFGTLGGYYGGKIDKMVMWLINVVWSIPTLLMVIAITLSLGKGFWQVFLAVGLTMWVEVARVVRGQMMSVKKAPYITAAKALGFSNFRIITKHIFPNIFGPIIVIATANFAAAILIESGLSFLGLGAQPPTPSWGTMIKDYYGDMILGRPYLALIPGIAIMTTVLAFMMLGNGLRDYFDRSKNV